MNRVAVYLWDYAEISGFLVCPPKEFLVRNFACQNLLRSSETAVRRNCVSKSVPRPMKIRRGSGFIHNRLSPKIGPQLLRSRGALPGVQAEKIADTGENGAHT